MENLIKETNNRFIDIIKVLKLNKDEQLAKLNKNAKDIKDELALVKEYKDKFISSKAKVEKMTDDINGFEKDYQNLVERFKGDELANILISANKEISVKIEERKRQIMADQVAMNELIEKAGYAKNKLLKLTAEKKIIEGDLKHSEDAYNFYKETTDKIIEYTEKNSEDLCACFREPVEEPTTTPVKEEEPTTTPVKEEKEPITEEVKEVKEEKIEEKPEKVVKVVKKEDTKKNQNNNKNKNNKNKKKETPKKETSKVEEEKIEKVKEEPKKEVKIESPVIEEIDVLPDDEIIEGNEHNETVETMPSGAFDLSDELDLENLINFDDSIE